MKELHLEAPAVVGPERLVGAIVDSLVLIPVEGFHRLGDMVHRRLVGAGGEPPCLPLEPGIVESLWRTERAERGGGSGCRGAQVGKRQAGYSERSKSAQEIASLHSSPSYWYSRRHCS